MDSRKKAKKGWGPGHKHLVTPLNNLQAVQLTVRPWNDLATRLALQCLQSLVLTFMGNGCFGATGHLATRQQAKELISLVKQFTVSVA